MHVVFFFGEAYEVHNFALFYVCVRVCVCVGCVPESGNTGSITRQV